MAEDINIADETQIPDEEEFEPLHIVALKDWCFRNEGSSCTRCVQACPQSALSFDEGNMPTIDPLLCTECGICLGICDNFADDRTTLEGIWKQADYLSGAYGCAYLCCQETLFPGFYPALNVMVLPCLAALPPELWTLLLAKGTQFRVFYDEDACSTCPLAAPQAQMLFQYATHLAESITGQNILLVDELPEKENIASEFIKSGSFDRRGIFSSTISSVGDLASGEYSRRTTDAALEALITRERVHAEGRVRNGDRTSAIPGAFLSRVLPPKHELIKEIERVSPDIASRIPRVVSITDKRMCDNCASPKGKSFDCIEVCPTHARRKVFGKEMLDYSKDYCIGCGLCVTPCPNHAITLRTS